mgnify:CR=1 FL=1
MRGSFLAVIALMKLLTAFFLTAMTINCCAYLLYLHMKDWLLQIPTQYMEYWGYYI